MSKHTARKGTGRGVGRPSKPGGPRRPHTIYFPVDLLAEIKESAAAAGYDGVTEYVVDICYRAKAAGQFPEAVPGQETLPISA